MTLAANVPFALKVAREPNRIERFVMTPLYGPKCPSCHERYQWFPGMREPTCMARREAEEAAAAEKEPR